MRQKHDKTDILKKGIQLFREKGYHNTGVDDILRTCNIPSGSFYNFFKNKEGFAIQALELYNAQYLDYLNTILDDQKLSPTKRLQKLFRQNVKDHKVNDCSLGCLLNSMTSEVAAINLNIATTTSEHYQKNASRIAMIIKEGQDAGEIRKDFNATDLAFYLIDSFSGATIRMQAGRTEQPLKLFMRTAFKFLQSG